MALTTSQVTQLTDSISQALSDFNATFVVGTANNAPTSATIIGGISGTGTTNTLGRVLNWDDLQPELSMLSAANTMANSVTAYIGGLQSLTGFYAQWYPLFNALDLNLGGISGYLSVNSLQVNARFAVAFNYWTTIATQVSARGINVPSAIAAANFFPYAAIDTMWGFTASGATTFSSNAVGANTSTSGSGGGVGQFYLYKANATNAVGGATFTVSYTNAAGGTATATYTTSSGTPAGSGSLSSGYAISGAIGSAITGVTATGMTSGEQYVIGMKMVRALSGY